MLIFNYKTDQGFLNSTAALSLTKNMMQKILLMVGLVLLTLGWAEAQVPNTQEETHITNPIVIIKTPLGTIVLELYPKQAPITVNNFERYIRESRFKGASFYRTVRLDNQAHNKVKIEVIQGGLFVDNHPAMLPPIPLETTAMTGLHHLDGSLSMARDKPNSASSEFFICIGDQPSLDYKGKRNPDGQGFAVFGRVIRGMKVVRKIQQQPAVGQMLNPHIPIEEITLQDSLL